MIQSSCYSFFADLVAALGAGHAVFDAAEVDFAELVAKVFGLHELVVLPVRANHVPPLRHHALRQVGPVWTTMEHGLRDESNSVRGPST